MRPNRFVRLAVALLAPLLVAGGVVAQAGTAFADAGHHSHVLYVSARAKHWNSDRSCRSAAFKTIQSAVNAAHAGGTIVVCPGTYHEQVVISKPLTLAGKEATIDETGVTPTFQVTPPGLGTQTIFAAVVMASSGIDFTGFKVQHAQGEGILALYGEYFRWIPVEYQIAFGLPAAGPEIIGIALNRAERDFTEDERDLLSVIRVPLMTALERARQRQRARDGLVTAASGALADLTDREIRVLRLAALGRTNSAIARALDVSPRTVAKHLEHIYRKLDVTSRTSAVFAALTGRS